MLEEFVELQPTPKGYTPKRDPVKFGLMKIGGGYARGTLFIRRDVLAQVGFSTWRCKIMLGKGSRAHQVAVIPDPQGPFELSSTARKGKAVDPAAETFRVMLPLVEAFPDVSSAATERDYKIEVSLKSKVLVVDLPPFCWDKGSRDRLVKGKAAS
ncbi:hypothetical protein HDIA_2250 [Hartmannibacter diazotrophicus]|uniref:Uncharacterized protein n=1 Tax=Hartmannibacter diazotrophicus TaxID=1482074 RepID=A0A2C9D7R8_9HYPH|nr:hypothetical protein [Hartmannibacter diazotrophicus]SON55791.1 hypothetical protein HDIA_2250 [Hartmannibacter diazotrophicus]